MEFILSKLPFIVVHVTSTSCTIVYFYLVYRRLLLPRHFLAGSGSGSGTYNYGARFLLPAAASLSISQRLKWNKKL